MVTVDDATYVAMRDNLYKWDAWAASRAKAKIESSYSQQQYDTFLSQLNGMSGSTPKTTTTTTTRATPQDTSRDQWNGNYVYNPNTWYYEKEWTARATQTTPTTPTTKQDTTTKQQETVGTTTNEIKQQGAMKPLSQEYYNQTNDVALNQIKDNLNRYKQSNPEYFVNYDTFKNNFSYDARNEEQKRLLDDWYKWYQEGLSLASTPTTDLYNQYQNWSISSEQLEQLRVSDPAKYSELMNQINKWNIVAAYDDDKWTGITGNSIQEMAYQAAQQMFMQWMNGNNDSWASQFFREYEEKMDSPEMKWLSDQCTEVQEKIENLQDDIASMKKAVEEEYEWTWASRAKINAIIADRTYDLQLQLRTANSEYNKYATQYNNRMQQYQNEFQLQLQEYQINQQARQQQMQELWFAMDLMSFETPQQSQERQWNYWVKQQEYVNWNINSKDYSTRHKAALNSVQNLLSQYEWIPMQRSAEQMADDILKAIDNWSNLWAELTKINKQIQQKPEYKYMYNATFSSWSWKGSVIQDTMKIGDIEWVKYNNQRYTSDEFNKMLSWQGMSWEAKPYELVSEEKLQNNIGAWVTWNLGKFLIQKANGMTGWQCGKYVNDYLQYIWMTWAANRYYDDELSTKLNSINSYVPKVWTIAVFDYNHKSSDWINHGHVGIVTKVYEDWSFDIKDSNFKWDEKIHTRHIANDEALRWFFDPSQPPKNTGNASSLWKVDEAKKQNYIEEAKRGMLTDTKVGEIWDLAAKQWWSEEWREALKQGRAWNLTDAQQKGMDKEDSKFLSSTVVKEFEDAQTQMQQLMVALNDESWIWDMSAIFTFMKTLDPSSVVRESEFNSAAATAWVLNPQAIWQKLEKSYDWKFLTPQQREDYKKIAKEFIKIKSNAYQMKYNDLLKRYDYYGISHDLAPTNWAEEILKEIDSVWQIEDNRTQVKSALQSKYGIK